MKVPTLPARIPGMLNCPNSMQENPGQFPSGGEVTQLALLSVHGRGMAHRTSLCHTVPRRYPRKRTTRVTTESSSPNMNCLQLLSGGELSNSRFGYRTTGGLVPSRRWTFRGLIQSNQPTSFSVSGISIENPPRTTRTHTNARKKKNLHHIQDAERRGWLFPKKPH